MAINTLLLVVPGSWEDEVWFEPGHPESAYCSMQVWWGPPTCIPSFGGSTWCQLNLSHFNFNLRLMAKMVNNCSITILTYSWHFIIGYVSQWNIFLYLIITPLVGIDPNEM